MIEPARGLGDGNIERKIRGLLDSWMTWNHSFQGSCMFLDAWNDAADKNCPLQAALRKAIDTWLSYLEIQIAKGKENQEFISDLDTRQATFDLYGQYLSAHVFYSIKGEEELTPILARHRQLACSMERLTPSTGNEDSF